ncbi:MAG: division/cell wall cluster transcriptional repressor MraZ [Chlorobium phaeobacteroides]|jgi:MraZ protein|nr:division/cell wall cluster transcriptional repressor MraZ [Chlorobium phaeobacteroides]
MAGFIGKERHALDEKGRLMIPVRFRRELSPESTGRGSTIYLMKAPDGSIELYEPDIWEGMKKSLAVLSDFNPEERLLKTMIYESLDVVAIDRQGRVPFSREFLEHAGIVKDVIIIGADTKMIIWAPERLSLLVMENAERYSSLARRYF